MDREIYRAPWHDYRSRCIYMVTMNKAAGMKDFGSLAGDVRIPRGQVGSPFVSTSEVGAAIKIVLRRFYEIEPAARILQYAVMPDHLHLLIFIETPTEDSLGQILARFKVAVNNQLGSGKVFDKGFNDQILKGERSLDDLYNYLRDNPRRLAERLANPDFFRRVSNLQIGGIPCQAYGNLQLLENPFKEQVVVHRADSQQQRVYNRLQWLYTADNGGVLVSPFISPSEREIRNEAEGIDGAIILISNLGFGERQKPTGRDFEQCAKGKLLIITPVDPVFTAGLTRRACLAMNDLAARICRKAGQ